jgi:hypothetical protein
VVAEAAGAAAGGESVNWLRIPGIVACRMLMIHSERLATAEGAASLWVTAATQALGFYEACGFVRVGDVATRFGQALRMRKSLDATR